MALDVSIVLQDGYDRDWCTSCARQKCDVVSKAEIDVFCKTIGQYILVQWK